MFSFEPVCKTEAAMRAAVTVSHDEGQSESVVGF
jgi:hypothetical protein